MTLASCLSTLALASLLALPAWFERLWKKPLPEVVAAQEKIRKGDAPAAVDILDKVTDQLKEPRDQGVLAFDKSAALLMVGKQGAPRAADEARRALDEPASEVHAPAAYNLGFALADQGKRDEAIDAYGKSLQLEATDIDAKYNLELLLREKQEQQQGGQGNKKDDKPSQDDKDKDKQRSKGEDDQQQKQDSKDQKDQDKDKQEKQSQPKSEDKDQQKPDQGKDPKQDKAQGQKPEQEPPRDKKDQQQQAQQRPVDRTEAQRLLDALRASEKNLQVWRFGQRRAQPARPRDVEKDW
jgi:hypothetical protein